MELKWKVSGVGKYGTIFLQGEQELPVSGCFSVEADIPEDTVLDIVTAEIPWHIRESEKIFMNGFQTWTYCPEYDKRGRTRGLKQIPEHLKHIFKFDRYGDYHFVDYPYRRGITHGESWCYFRDGSTFRLLASTDETNGYTLFTYDVSRSVLTIKRDCSGLEVSGKFDLFDLILETGEEDEVFDRWFDAMGIKPRVSEKIYGYSSWYNRYQKISEASILQDLKGCSTIFEKNDLFQVDDGWERFVGDWLEPDSEKFPSGMKAMADRIHEDGFRAGLWLAPFVAEKKSAVFKRHPDWFFKVNESPWCDGANWSGFYSLDIDNAEVQNYLRAVFSRVFDEWGFDLVKLDFLYGAAPFGTLTETRAARMRRAMEFIRELAGDKLVLGCGVPVMPAFGLVDYCRVSCDVSLSWNDYFFIQFMHRERVSTKQAIENTVFRRELNGRAYLSDPDVFFLRYENIKMDIHQKKELAAINALLGGVFLTSDDPSSYTDPMKRAYKKYRHLTEAENVRVRVQEGNKSITVSYDLDGENHVLHFEHK